MFYYTLPSVNITNGSRGFEEIAIYTSGQVPFLFPGILLLIFIVILTGGYFSQERSKGNSNLSMWFAIAGFITTTLSFVLFLYNGIINILTVSIILLVTIVSTIFFLFSKDK